MGPTPINDGAALAPPAFFTRMSRQCCKCCVFPCRARFFDRYPRTSFSPSGEHRRVQKSLLFSFVAALLLQRTVVSRHRFPNSLQISERKPKRDTRSILYQHPYSLFCPHFYFVPSHSGHSQQNLLLRFLVDTAVGVCGICPRTPEHVS